MSAVIIAASVALTAVLSLATAVIGLLNQRRTMRTAAKIEQISVQVNGHLSALLERQDQLLSALHENDIPIPPAPAAEAEADEGEGNKGGVPPSARRNGEGDPSADRNT